MLFLIVMQHLTANWQLIVQQSSTVELQRYYVTQSVCRDYLMMVNNIIEILPFVSQKYALNLNDSPTARFHDIQSSSRELRELYRAVYHISKSSAANRYLRIVDKKIHKDIMIPIRNFGCHR